jgi:hypothetical protein
MPHNNPPSWEPEPQKMGNWRAMFESDRGGKPPEAPPSARGEPPREQAPDDEAPGLDLSVYRPWILQRGRSRPAMMLEFRRFEPRSGLWAGWAIAYPHLVALEYTGDKMLSLDFGTRQVIVEGQGLDELARLIQQGSVVTIQEYAAQLWPMPTEGGSISVIRELMGAKYKP